MTGSGLPRVLLVRGLERPMQPSMRRFGAELERALSASKGVELEESVVFSPLRVPRLDDYLARYASAPLALARRRGRDVVFHITDQSNGHLAAITPPSQTVISCHDLMLLRARERTAGFRGRPWTTKRFSWSTSFLRRVARVVCPTEATKADVVRLRGVAPERISVVPNGLGEQFQPLGSAARERIRTRLGLRGPTILHVSTGQPYKNVPGTLHVLATVRASGIDATLVRVGAPLRRSERTLCRELKLDRMVRELGVVPEAGLIEIYTAADVFLFPSHAEGFGWPPLEAMACGTPVVTSEDPALVEVVGDAGLRTDARDVAGLAAAVSSLITDPDLAGRLRSRGRDRASEYSWARAGNGYAAVYEELTR